MLLKARILLITKVPSLSIHAAVLVLHHGDCLAPLQRLQFLHSAEEPALPTARKCAKLPDTLIAEQVALFCPSRPYICHLDSIGLNH